jgi:hypothetical protein
VQCSTAIHSVNRRKNAAAGRPRRLVKRSAKGN